MKSQLFYIYNYSMVKVRRFSWRCCLCCIVLLIYVILFCEPAMTTTKLPLVGWLKFFELNWIELNIHRSDYSAVWLLHDWCHVELLSSRREFCGHVVSTENWPWRRKFSRRFFRDSNVRYLDHESVALPLGHLRSPQLLGGAVKLVCTSECPL